MKRRAQRAVLVVLALGWFGLWALPRSPETTAIAGKLPCVQAEIRGSGSRWSPALSLHEAGRRLDGRILADVGDPRSDPSSVRLAHLDTADVPKLIQCIGEALGVDVRTALNVAACESHFDPQARNGSYIGVFQIHVDLFAARARALGLGAADPTDAWSNVFVALSIVRAEGWGRWACA